MVEFHVPGSFYERPDPTDLDAIIAWEDGKEQAEIDAGDARREEEGNDMPTCREIENWAAWR